MLPSFLIPLIGVIVVVIVAFYGFTARGYFVHLALLATPIFIFLINNPAQWFVLIMGLIYSKMIFPGLPQGLHVSHVMIAGFSIVMLAHNIIAKPRQKPLRIHEFFLIAFTLVVMATAAKRGLGIRGLGGASWGGMAYIKLFICAGFLLACRDLVLKPKQIRLAIYLMLLFSTIPFVAQLIFTISGGAIYQQYMFVQAHVGGLLSTLQGAQTGGLVRYQVAGSVANTLLMAGLILIEPKGIKKPLVFGIVIGSLLLTGLSGFRGLMLQLMGTIAIYVFLVSSPKQRASRVILAGLAGLLALAITYPTIQMMPSAVQRALSWLPGIRVSYAVALEAAQSSAWRLEVWAAAWREVPTFLWIGKGFTVNPGELVLYAVKNDSVLRSIISHNYHSGPLSLLLDLGLFGFITGTGFLITSAVNAYRRLRKSYDNPLLYRFYIFFLAKYLIAVPSYYIIFGDVRETFPQLFITLATLTVAANVLESSAARATQPAVAAPVRRQPMPGVRGLPARS